MSGEHNLTPEQRMIPKDVRATAYQDLPMTCDTVRSILDQVKAEFMRSFMIPAHDEAMVDAIISLAFLRIRDEVTQPFRTVQMRLLMRTRRHTKDPQTGVTEHGFEGNLYKQLGTEFGIPVANVKVLVFNRIHGIATDRRDDEQLIDYCRRGLIEMGQKSQMQTIRFVRDSSAVVTTPTGFGEWESENFDKYSEHRAVVEPCGSPDTDMSDITFDDGRKCRLVTEEFEIVEPTATPED